MRIIIDYDNDCVRFGKERDMDDGNEKRIVVIKGFTSQSIKTVKTLLCELINMMCDREEHVIISLQQQSDGIVMIIEEY